MKSTIPLLPGWFEMLRLARPLESVPVRHYFLKRILQQCFPHPGFVTTDRYPRDFVPVRGELGYMATFRGPHILTCQAKRSC